MDRIFIWLTWAAWISVCFISICTDVRKRMIYNIVVGPAILIALVLSYIRIDGPGIGYCLLSMAILFGFTFPFYLLGFFGAGDAKLLIAAAALLGWETASGFLAYAVFASALWQVGESLKTGVRAGTAAQFEVFLINMKRACLQVGAKKKPGGERLVFAGFVGFATMIEYLFPLRELVAAIHR